MPSLRFSSSLTHKGKKSNTMAVPVNQANRSYHFYISDPKNDDDFEDQLEHSIKRLSKKTLLVDHHEPSSVDSLPVVLVRLFHLSRLQVFRLADLDVGAS
jgi:hypothetical protein